jgi:peptidoglycan hydrolase-like protein with peptidoglycan-binding domain
MARQWPLVKRGAQSVTVRVVQYLLRERGHDLDVDGVFGAATEQQVEQFQQANNVSADGIVGNQTWPLLIVQVAQGSTGDAVRAVQDHLRVRDLPETDDLDVDGIFGPDTDAAVRAFQSWVTDHQSDVIRLTADGIVGPNTWWALVAALGPVVD